LGVEEESDALDPNDEVMVDVMVTFDAQLLGLFSLLVFSFHFLLLEHSLRLLVLQSKVTNKYWALRLSF
jgi:hypothetical protein